MTGRSVRNLLAHVFYGRMGGQLKRRAAEVRQHPDGSDAAQSEHTEGRR